MVCLIARIIVRHCDPLRGESVQGRRIFGIDPRPFARFHDEKNDVFTLCPARQNVAVFAVCLQRTVPFAVCKVLVQKLHVLPDRLFRVLFLLTVDKIGKIDAIKAE